MKKSEYNIDTLGFWGNAKKNLPPDSRQQALEAGSFRRRSVIATPNNIIAICGMNAKKNPAYVNGDWL